MKSKSLKSAVQNVLEKYPSSRDSDIYCYTWVLNDEWGIDLHNVSSLDLLKMIDAGKCPKFDSVARLRREIQEQNVELRGREWRLRHAEAEQVRQQKSRLMTKELTGV